MAEGTTFRLDTADVAIELGWHVDSSRLTDEFTKDGLTITVEYSPEDDINSVASSGQNRDHELMGRDATARHDVLRAWLAGRVPTAVESAKPFHSNRSRAPKLRWSHEKWLHKPTQEVVDKSDPRVPRTVDAAKKVSKIWYKMWIQADDDYGRYRCDIDLDTTTAVNPTFTATWQPRTGPAEVLIRGTDGEAYLACVRHHQAQY